MKKQQVFFIHGGESFLNDADFQERLKTAPLWHLPVDEETLAKKWTSSLGEDLGDDYEVVMPPMPNKQNAKYEEWEIWFERHFDYLRDGAILIGFSLGAMFLAKYLSRKKLPFSTKAVFLMAGAYALPSFNDKSCGDFLVSPLDVAEGISDDMKLVIVHSKDDHVVSFEHGQALADAIPNAEFMMFDDRNHFLLAEFPELLEKIRLFAKN